MTEASRLLGLLLLVHDDCMFDKRCPHCDGELGQGHYVLRAYTVRTLLEQAIVAAKAFVSAEVMAKSEAIDVYDDAVGSA